MRLTWCAPLLLGVLAGCSGSSAPAVAHSSFDGRAAAALTEIQHGDCTATANDFDATVKGALSPAGLCTAYETYTQQFGKLDDTGGAYSTKRGLITVVRIPLTMSHAKGEFRVAYHPEGTIAGIYFLKEGVPLP